MIRKGNMGTLCPFKVADHGLNKMATPLFPRTLNLQGTTLLWFLGEEATLWTFCGWCPVLFVYTSALHSSQNHFESATSSFYKRSCVLENLCFILYYSSFFCQEFVAYNSFLVIYRFICIVLEYITGFLFYQNST